jgi:hypothetical protein
LLLLVVSYGFSPRAYMVSGRAIVVRRIFGNATFPLDTLREVRPGTADDIAGSLRLFGNGGYFGYYGIFRTPKLGKCTWYVTNRSKLVVAITDSKAAVFSPDDVDGFVAAVLPSAEAAPASARPIDAPRRTGWGFTLVGAVVGALALGVVLVAMVYSPGPPGYSLTSDTLAIHDRFYPVNLSRDAIDVAGIRVVDLDQDQSWKPVERTNGFANQHYRAGWFRVANGQTVRVYNAGGRRVVLLPGKGNGATVLIEVPDPEGFAREAQRLWSSGS